MYRKFWPVLSALALACLLTTLVPCIRAGENPFLVSQKLEQCGFHLASQVSSVQQQVDYQAALTTHQELTVEWDSLPGFSKTVRKEEVAGIKPSANFAITDRKQNLKGSPGRSQLLIVDGELVVIGVTSTGEVRSIAVQWDPRTSYTEDVAHAKPRIDFVKPKVTFQIFLPDDPTIEKIVFLQPVPAERWTWNLQEIGTVRLEGNAK